MIRDFVLGFVRVHILHHAAQEPLYGLAIIQELRRHGYDLGAGTLYPVLHGLEEAGYLIRQQRTVGGRVRKYYAITPAGRRALSEAREKVAELVEEVIEGRGPKKLRAEGPPRRARPAGDARRPRRRPAGSRSTAGPRR